MSDTTITTPVAPVVASATPTKAKKANPAVARNKAIAAAFIAQRKAFLAALDVVKSFGDDVTLADLDKACYPYTGIKSKDILKWAKEDDRGVLVIKARPENKS